MSIYRQVMVAKGGIYIFFNGAPLISNPCSLKETIIKLIGPPKKEGGIIKVEGRGVGKWKGNQGSGKSEQYNQKTLDACLKMKIA